VFPVLTTVKYVGYMFRTQPVTSDLGLSNVGPTLRSTIGLSSLGITPNSLRPHLHHRRRRGVPHRPLLLRLRALPSGEYRRVASDQMGRVPSIRDLFGASLNGTPATLWQRQSAWTATMSTGAVTFFSSFRSSDLSQSI